MRKAIVAGQFYPEDKAELEKQINGFLEIKPDNSLKAAIVPHAGYMFSGKCAGKVYSLLPAAETYVLLGVNHQNLGENIAVSLESFETPLGVVENDTELGEEILKNLKTREDNQAHKHEHSIEVQLPFLQITQKTQNFKIVPILLKNYTIEICKNLAKAVFDSVNKLKRKIVLLASSDFTHTGSAYGFHGDIKVDKEAINKILEFNTKDFLEIAEKTTICGAGAIAATIETAKLLKAKKAELIDYYTSADIIPSENKVGYASIAFFA